MLSLKYKKESNPSLSKQALLWREWAILAIVASLILICCVASWVMRLRAKAEVQGWDQLSEASKKIEIEVCGAVSRPGCYCFSPGVTLKEVLQTAELNKQADRKKINFKKVIYVSERIEVPTKPPRQKKARRKSVA